MQICSVCKKNKKSKEFRVRSDNGKLRSVCKHCENERQKKYYRENKSACNKYRKEHHEKNLEHDKEVMRTYYQTTKEERRENSMLAGAKSRAKLKELPFNLTLEDVNIPKLCPVLKIPLVSGVGKLQDASPTLDRKIPMLGYVRGNVQVISCLANRIKSNANSLQIAAVLEYVKQIEQENT